MKKSILIVMLFLAALFSETLFEVKDASNNKVLDISTDGLRVMNQGDTLMVISSNEIKANISSSKGLSRTFSVTTNSAKGSGIDLMRLTADSTRFWISDSGSGFGVSSLTAAKEKSVATDFLKVSNANTEMREGNAGGRYTDFSPENIFVGLNSGVNSTGINNVFVGNDAGLTNGKGYSNVFVGPQAGYSNSSGGHNVFIGTMAGYTSSSKHSNTFVGHEAGALSNAECNTFMGYRSGYGNSTGGYNSFYGQYSGNNIGIGTGNCMFGFQAGVYVKDGHGNTIMGYDAGHGSSSYAYNYNCLFGGYAGNYLSSGSNNVMMGYQSGYSTAGNSSGNVFLGYQSGYSETGSNKLYIDNSNTTSPLIYGDFSTNALTVNGTLSVTGNTSVGGAFTSTGNATFSSNAFLNGTYFRINTDPGTTTTPVSYVYQGGSANSTSKRYAFTVNDALWVTSHTYIDGNLTLKGGTAIGKTQAGILTVGTNSSANYKAVTLTFPSAFSTIPKINVTPVNDSGINDIYSVTVRNITTTNCVVLICRVDSTIKTWGQNLKADWFAWE